MQYYFGGRGGVFFDISTQFNILWTMMCPWILTPQILWWIVKNESLMPGEKTWGKTKKIVAVIILVHDIKLFHRKCTKLHDILFQIMEMWDKHLVLNVHIFYRWKCCETRGIKAPSFKRYPNHSEHRIPPLINWKACCTFCCKCHILDS